LTQNSPIRPVDMALAARGAADGGRRRWSSGRVGEFCYFVIHAVAWPVAELSAVPPGGERHQVGSDQCGRCHVGGPNRVGHLASGQLAALVQQFVYRPDRGRPAVLTAHPANGGQQSQLAVDGLPVARLTPDP
jgi:hypothetical protein